VNRTRIRVNCFIFDVEVFQFCERKGQVSRKTESKIRNYVPILHALIQQLGGGGGPSSFFNIIHSSYLE
jgi:hypothetical protein